MAEDTANSNADWLKVGPITLWIGALTKPGVCVVGVGKIMLLPAASCALVVTTVGVAPVIIGAVAKACKTAAGWSPVVTAY